MSAWTKWVKPEVYPIFACIGGATVWAAYVGGKNMAYSPDVVINKSKPAPYENYNGESFLWTRNLTNDRVKSSNFRIL